MKRHGDEQAAAETEKHEATIAQNADKIFNSPRAVTIGNQDFSLAGYPTATVEFLNGQLYNISFAQTVGSSPNRFTLDTSGVYAFYYNDGQAESAGSITATPAVIPDLGSTQPASSPTPEPGTLLLFVTALVGRAILLFRRRRSAHS